MGMTTARYLISRIRSAGGFHTVTQKKKGWLFVVRLDGDSYDTYINLLDTGKFIISLPIGNKIDCSFFPSSEKLMIMEYFAECVEPKNV